MKLKVYHQLNFNHNIIVFSHMKCSFIEMFILLQGQIKHILFLHFDVNFFIKKLQSVNFFVHLN
jgi:hypothetical protein